MTEDKKNYSMCRRTSLISDLYCDSQVLEAFKVSHSAGDFTIQVVAGEIKCLELDKLAGLCWDWPGYVVILQEAATGKTKRNLLVKKVTPNTEQAGNDKAIVIIHERKNNTHTISMFVRFPMLGESVPERFLLGASLPNNQANIEQ
jgi:hypothetical protein